MPSSPIPTESMRQLYGSICNGNGAALEFLCGWHHYCHCVDDLIDEPHSPQKHADQVCALLIQAATIYSSPFYRQHAEQLYLIVVGSTSAWLDSVKWEAADQALWKRQAADVLRHSGNEMVFAVATICGGYEHMRNYSAALRAICYVHHHDEYGDPK